MKNFMEAKIGNGNSVKQPILCNSFPKMNYDFTWAKTTPLVHEIVDLSPIGCATHKTWNSQPWECRNNTKMPNRDPIHWMSTKPLPSHGKDEEHCKSIHGECRGAPKTWGRQQRECPREWAAFLGVNLPQKVINTFTKMCILMPCKKVIREEMVWHGNFLFFVESHHLCSKGLKDLLTHTTHFLSAYHINCFY